MPLTTSKEMLLSAQRGSYAVCAFNTENMEMVQAIVSAAESASAPVIIQTTPSTIKYAGMDYFRAMVATAAMTAAVPVALHLDHGDSYALACQAVRAGYTSVMIDGSKLPFEENISLTAKVAELARSVSIPVEGELGCVGGKEDSLEAGAGGYTDPEEAARFVSETGIDSLAVGIGTAHGFYAEKPVLDMDRLSLIRERVSVPLVLHGATGLSDEDIIECIRRGICKVNFATEMRAAFTRAVRETLERDSKIVDVKAYGKAARQAVMETAVKKIVLCGAANKAALS